MGRRDKQPILITVVLGEEKRAIVQLIMLLLQNIIVAISYTCYLKCFTKTNEAKCSQIDKKENYILYPH